MYNHLLVPSSNILSLTLLNIAHSFNHDAMGMEDRN